MLKESPPTPQGGSSAFWKANWVWEGSHDLQGLCSVRLTPLFQFHLGNITRLNIVIKQTWTQYCPSYIPSYLQLCNSKHPTSCWDLFDNHNPQSQHGEYHILQLDTQLGNLLSCWRANLLCIGGNPSRERKKDRLHWTLYIFIWQHPEQVPSSPFYQTCAYKHRLQSPVWPGW